MGNGVNFTKNRKRAISNLFKYDKIEGIKTNLDRLRLCEFTSSVLVKLHDIMTKDKPSKARRMAELGEDIVARYEHLRGNKERSYIWTKKFALNEDFQDVFPRRDNTKPLSNGEMAEDDSKLSNSLYANFHTYNFQLINFYIFVNI